eukprot:1600966-Alexandrium_andersonii.AAC.1
MKSWPLQDPSAVGLSAAQLLDIPAPHSSGRCFTPASPCLQSLCERGPVRGQLCTREEVSTSTRYPGD